MATSSQEYLSQQEVVINSPRSLPKSPKSPSTLNSSLHQINKKIEKRSRRSESGLGSTGDAPKRDQKLNRLVFEERGLPDGSKVKYVGGKIPKTGQKVGHQIECDCCKKLMSPSVFEAHAGEASRRKPYAYIYTSFGVSLHHLACCIRASSEILRDNLCRVCLIGGGDLFQCVICPRSFHKECILGKTIDPSTWFCKYCKDIIIKCGGSVAKGLKGQGFEGVDLIDLPIVNNLEKSDRVACSLCRAHEFSETGFNYHTVIVCDQCEREYHIGCLRKHTKHTLKELPAGNWFCKDDCRSLHSILKHVVAAGPEKVPEPLMDIIMDDVANLDVKWIVIHGREASPENRSLLEEAVEMFHDCFNPIVDSVTGSDFIPSMVHGQIMGDSNFVGVYTAMLTIDSEVVTAGMFRVFGKEMAELPIVGTKRPYQGKGYFQLLFACLEKLLWFLEVKKIVLPAAEDTKSMWIDRFGFENVNPQQLKEYTETQTSMVAFRGTSLLEKEVDPHCEYTFEDPVRFSLDMESTLGTFTGLLNSGYYVD